MYTDVVRLSHYASLGEGAGIGTAQDLAELQKAMFAGSITGQQNITQNATGGSVLKVESLENTLTWLSSKETDIVLWNKIPKSPAYNTVEEFNQLVDYGEEGNSFNNEGELPQEDDATYKRNSTLIKFMGSTGSVSHPMQLVKTQAEIGDIMQHKIRTSTLKVLRDVDRKILTGNSAVIPQEFDGIYTQQINSFASIDAWYQSEVVIDLKGKALTEDAFQDAALAIVENYGRGTMFMSPPSILTNFAKRFHSFKLIQPNTPAVSGAEVGENVLKFWSQFGMIDLGYDLFMAKMLSKKRFKTTTDTKTNTNAPDAPVADATTPKAAATDTSGQFLAAFAGDYYYAVSAINRYGESPLAVLATGGAPNAKVTLTAAQVADLKFTDGGGPVAATGYRIYRSVLSETSTTAAGAKFYPLFDISVAQLS